MFSSSPRIVRTVRQANASGSSNTCPTSSQHGFEFTWANLLDASDDAIFYRPGPTPGKAWVLAKAMARRVRDVARAGRFDAILLFREALPLGTTLFERQLRHRGVPMIFDFDDAIWLDATSEANRRFAWMKRADKTGEIIALCTIVMAGNTYLAEYARQFNRDVRVVPTTIDTDEYQRVPQTRASDRICIGWSGSTTTIEHFRQAIPALRTLRERYRDRLAFTVIGDADYRCPDLDVQALPWHRDTELDDLSRFDIGIMPLPDDPWAQGKCGLKGLQYMALEVPTVMSPVGVNQEIIAHGKNGLLARSNDEWVYALSTLIESADLRRRLGSAARETVIARYSVRSQQDTYLSIFNDACARNGRT